MLSQNQTAPFPPEDYQAALDALVKELDKDIGGVFQKNRNVLEQQINVQVARNDGLALAPIQRVMGDDIKSQDINGLMQAAFFDIQAIYQRIRRSRDMRIARESVQKATLADPESRYSMLKDRVKVLEYLMKYAGNDRASFISFKDGTNLFRGDNAAAIERDLPRLMLPLDSSRNLALGAAVTFTPLSGGTMTEDSGHGTDKIIDRDPRSYWSVTLFNPSPLPAIDVALGSGQTYRQATGSPVSGAIGSLEVRLAQVSQLNCVKIKPFGKYPIRVIDISSSVDDDSEFDQVPMFNPALATPNTDYIMFQFGLIEARRLRFIIAQENPEEVHLEIDTQRVNNSTLGDLIDPDVMDDVRGSAAEPPLVSKAVNALRAAVLSTAGMPGDKQLETVIAAAGQVISGLDYDIGAEVLKRTSTPPDSALRNLRGYSYSIGISDIQILNNVYSSSGFFVSAGRGNQNDIVRAQIVTDETHPVLYDSKGLPYVQTATEWSVGIGHGRTVPILPMNFSDNDGDPFVPCEELPFKTSKTRWAMDTSRWIEVRANGTRITGYEIKRSSTSTVVAIIDHNPNISYTIAYYPLVDALNPDPRDVFIEDLADAVPLTNEYAGTDDKGILTLGHFPYICREIVNDETHFIRPDPRRGKWYYTGEIGNILVYALADPLRAPMNLSYITFKNSALYDYYLIDGRKWGNLSQEAQAGIEGGIFFEYEPVIVQVGSDLTQNVTDYAFRAQIAPVTDTEYVHDGNRLIFNRKITDKIIVMSSVMADGVDVRCLLSCCRLATRDVTPMVKEVALLTAGRR